MMDVVIFAVYFVLILWAGIAVGYILFAKRPLRFGDGWFNPAWKVKCPKCGKEFTFSIWIKAMGGKGKSKVAYDGERMIEVEHKGFDRPTR